MILHVTLYSIVLYIYYKLYYYIVCYKSSYIYFLAAWDLAKGWNDDFGFSDEAWKNPLGATMGDEPTKLTIWSLALSKEKNRHADSECVYLLNLAFGVLCWNMLYLWVCSLEQIQVSLVGGLEHVLFSIYLE